MTTKGKLLTPAAAWDSLYRSLSAGPVFYDPDQPPFSQVRADIAAIRSRTQQVASYIPVTQGRNTEYLEILYQDRAKDSHAPRNLTYPRRRTAWPYLVLALFCYILIPRRNASDYSTYSRVVVAALDGIGAVTAGLFFALPLRISPSTDAVLGSQGGVTWFLWCLGAPGVFLVLWAARMAAFRISAGPAGLVVQTLWRGREMLFRDASAAGRLMRGGIAIGVYVRSNAGEVVKLSWAGLMRFQIVLDALYRAGLPMGEDLKA